MLSKVSTAGPALPQDGRQSFKLSQTFSPVFQESRCRRFGANAQKVSLEAAASPVSFFLFYFKNSTPSKTLRRELTWGEGLGRNLKHKCRGRDAAMSARTDGTRGRPVRTATSRLVLRGGRAGDRSAHVPPRIQLLRSLRKMFPELPP